MSEAEAATSSSETATMAAVATTTTTSPGTTDLLDDKMDEFLEPDSKRRKLTGGGAATAGRGVGSLSAGAAGDDRKHRLEERLGGILCCAVCLDLPRAAVYQCNNGHLMCAGCFTHLLADARLRDETATCPNCRVEISKTSATRNLAVENAVSELPADCQYCYKQFPRNSLEYHEENQCDERLTGCKFSRIGCPWRGPLHEGRQHEIECAHPQRTGAEVMDALVMMDQQAATERSMFETIFDLLAYEKIIFNDLQLKPYRTDEFVHRLFYETPRFTAFNNQWVVKARINNSQRDPTQSSERDITYQLMLKTKSSTPMSIYYIILRGPFGDMKVQPRIYKHDYSEQETEGPYMPLPLPDTTECNRLLASKTINFRLIMFLSSK